MNNSIEALLNLLSENKDVTDSLKNVLNGSHELTNDHQNTTVTEDKLALKINLMNAIIPFLSEKSKEHAAFIVKVLQIISLLQQNTKTND